MNNENQNFTIRIENIIVHKAEKEQFKETHLKLKDKPLTVDNNNENDPTVLFVKSFVESYLRRRAGKIYGVFNEDTVSYPFPTFLEKYISDFDILDLSTKMANRLKMMMDNAKASTGGFMFCMDYYYDDKRHFAVILLTTKGNTGINDQTLELESTFTLDIDEINMAVDIRLDEWFESKKEENPKSYLSFSGGKKKISDYFLNTIGCKDAPNASKATAALVQGIVGFLRTKNLSIERFNEMKSLAYHAIKDKGNTVDVEELKCTLFEKQEDRDGFEKYLASSNIILPDILDYDARSLKGLTQYHMKRKGFDMRIDNDFIGTYLDFSDGSAYPRLKIDGLKDDIEAYNRTGVNAGESADRSNG